MNLLLFHEFSPWSFTVHAIQSPNNKRNTRVCVRVLIQSPFEHYYSYNRLFMKDNHFIHTHQHTNSGLLSHLLNDTEAKPHNQSVGWFYWLQLRIET